MNKYKKLFSDTIIFAIGTFSSKVLVFVLMPLYSNILTDAEYGMADLITQTGNLLYPMVTLGIVSGCVRYALDASYDKRDVFSTGVKTILFGLTALFCIMPIFYFLGVIESFKLLSLVFLFVMMSSFRALCSQFIRAIGKVRLYAFDGILSTVFVLVLNVLLLVVFKKGVYGYVWATILSDFLSAVFLVIAGKLYQYVKIKNTNRKTMNSMWHYSIPLIPNNIFWWITNTSDRYLITFFQGLGVSGLYAAAQKLPTIIVLVSNIFMDAWQLSAVSDMDKEERGRFFTSVFNGYWALTCIASSGIILIAKPFIGIWLNAAYFDSWKFVPLLVLAMAYSCFVSFLGSVYMVNRKSNLSFFTTGVGAVLNIVLNIVLIPGFGGNGAAFATLVSYMVVFIMRMRNTEKFISIGYNIPKIILSTVLLLVQSGILLAEVKGWFIFQIVILIILTAMFFTDILKPVLDIIAKKRGK